jgi:hypothetical protein
MGGSAFLKLVMLAIMLTLLAGGSLLIALAITGFIRRGPVVRKTEEPKVERVDDHRRAA